MGTGGGNPFSGDFWRKLDAWFAEGFPLPKFSKDWLADPGHFDKTVHHVIRSLTSGGLGAEPSHNITVKPEYVSVKIFLPENTNPYALRAYVSTVKLRIEGLPGEGKLSITLPEEVSAVGTRAIYKDRVLIVRMPKKKSGKGRQIGIDIQ